MIHVYPIDDCQQHRLDTTCDCNPRVEFHSQILVIHESFDGLDESLDGKPRWVVEEVEE